MELRNNTGWIEVICGPMFAGKSEELIRRIKRLEYAKKNTLVFKPKMDNRYSEDEIVSHAMRRTKSFNIEKANEIYSYLKDDTDAIVIDEVQFLDEEIVTIANDLADKGIRVILGGLDSDFKGTPFPIMASLLSIAEDVTKLTAICVKCGAPATRTQRLVNGVPASINDKVILVGASECYEPRCRKCHEVRK